VTFVWLGMVLAISFLEAPLKSRVPQVSLRIGLGIGRLVFRARQVERRTFLAEDRVAFLADAEIPKLRGQLRKSAERRGGDAVAPLEQGPCL
jgi:hypothetical protein